MTWHAAAQEAVPDAAELCNDLDNSRCPIHTFLDCSTKVKDRCVTTIQGGRSVNSGFGSDRDELITPGGIASADRSDCFGLLC